MRVHTFGVHKMLDQKHVQKVREIASRLTDHKARSALLRMASDIETLTRRLALRSRTPVVPKVS
jgi:hypothetical protein